MATKKKAAKKVDTRINKPFDWNAFIKAINAQLIENEQAVYNAAKEMGLPPTTLQTLMLRKSCKVEALGIVCNWLQVPVQNFFTSKK